MLNTGIVTFYREGSFTLEEAKQLLPLIYRITDECSQKAEHLMAHLDAEDPNSQVGQELENKINSVITSWHDKIKKLGAHPKGLWLVDFDSGDGHFCWKFPEPQINFWHSYSDGFSNRKTIEEWLSRKATSRRKKSNKK